MNVRSLSEAKTKRKPDLEPYTTPDDSRLKVKILYGVYCACFNTQGSEVAHIQTDFLFPDKHDWLWWDGATYLVTPKVLLSPITFSCSG